MVILAKLKEEVAFLEKKLRKKLLRPPGVLSRAQFNRSLKPVKSVRHEPGKANPECDNRAKKQPEIGGLPVFHPRHPAVQPVKRLAKVRD